MKSEETVDINALLKLSGGDVDFVKEILSLFIEKTPAELERAERFYEAGNRKELVDVIHKLKSFTTPLGLMHLQSKLSGLEKVVKTTELASFRSEFDEVLLHTKEIVDRAKSQLGELK